MAIYRVGGAVRDELLGRPVADTDWVVVGATPEMMVASGYRPVGRDFPVFLHPQTHEEYALARTERKHGQGYRGFEFFASPDVTLEEDLVRRDLTINAMARAPDGTLIDPFGGRRDLELRVLRHVSPAFAEDPLRVLRVARFAARFGFDVAPATMRLMKRIVASGELGTLAQERVWTEFAKGLAEDDPYRMLAVLQRSGALAALAPELAARMALPRARRELAAMLTHAVGASLPLDRRYALIASDLAAPGHAPDPRAAAAARRANARAAARLSAAWKVPLDCSDLAVLAAVATDDVLAGDRLTPAQWMALFARTDALRRPGRLAALVDVAGAVASAARPAAASGGAGTLPIAGVVAEALAAVKAVDAGAIARSVQKGAAAPRRDDAIATAIAGARRAALAAWMRARR
ncbi:MAG: multifunctional CCA tRNA nucleotidyl transferase/2'3'-cyclic phosphodiesterase/2'nucleotidase/phosphatase [Proteobacteria bacterium]|nr:multifunctional CCA tRNA nucleotidyl transferase/2'3'-cyclic phosphodiesterase/2'nucleotidase/phosphatase [Pseudomonadota bacterium]